MFLTEGRGINLIAAVKEKPTTRYHELDRLADVPATKFVAIAVVLVIHMTMMFLHQVKKFNIRDLRRALPDFTWECVRPMFGVIAYEGRIDGMLVVVTMRPSLYRRHGLAIYTRECKGEKLESLFGLSDDGLLLRRSDEVYCVDEIVKYVHENVPQKGGEW